MGREAQKKREEEASEKDVSAEISEGAISAEDAKEARELDENAAQGQPLAIDPAMLGMLATPGMTALEDVRYLVQTIAVSKKSEDGLREITFPVNATKTITLVLAEDLQAHILKQLTGDLQIANLGDLEAVKKAAAEAEQS